MKKNGLEFNTRRMPEKWRPHFKIYRSKISIYLDTADFGVPLMVDASEMMGFLPAGIEDPSFVKEIGPVRPGGEAVWIEAEVFGGLPSRPDVQRIGAMVHRSKTRTSFMVAPFTGADNEFWMEIYLRDTDGLSTRLKQDVRFRLDGPGFLTGWEFMEYRSVLRPGKQLGETQSMFTTGDFEVQASGPDLEEGHVAALEAMNRVFFALALMNCRNVSLRERGSGRSTGAGPTGDAFHEVVIDGNARGSTRTGSASAGDAAGRRHLARGHFKTFTEDAPLLGKHVGTYWWGWQVRGQEGNGVIEKTYSLRASRR
ncbi:hypothetical protein [Arthrobacter sp. SAFR-044]|uniref:hypothetical protein n=1 Tax=Arthrobacter sp. SAFR-044 TaxID=3387278 RepID=UPI003F7B85CB